jgi:PIN domain
VRPQGTVSRIRDQLSHIVDDLTELVKTLQVLKFDQSGPFIYVGPQYHWGKLSETQRAAQLALKRGYEPLSELLKLIVRGTPRTFLDDFDEADRGLRVWLELESNFNVTPSVDANIKKLRSDATKFESILAALDVTRQEELILAPDTNSLLAAPDPTEYRKIASQDEFVFMLLPTVLGELDRLKVEHRNPEVREKARSAVTRIKGYRRQGSLAIGVTVDKTITVRAHHAEPDMKATLSWLDADIADDRILATVLTLYAKYPSASVILITGDVNLQNKADAALIATAEVPGNC